MLTFKFEILTLNLEISTLNIRDTLCIRTRKEKNNNKQPLESSYTRKKRGVLNVIKQLKNFILCNVMPYGVLKIIIDRGGRPWSILLFSAP
jgi:hypothetical protein